MSMSGSPKQPDIVMQVACGKKTPDTPKPMSRSQPPQRQMSAALSGQRLAHYGRPLPRSYGPFIFRR